MFLQIPRCENKIKGVFLCHHMEDHTEEDHTEEDHEGEDRAEDTDRRHRRRGDLDTDRHRLHADTDRIEGDAFRLLPQSV